MTTLLSKDPDSEGKTEYTEDVVRRLFGTFKDIVAEVDRRQVVKLADFPSEDPSPTDHQKKLIEHWEREGVERSAEVAALMHQIAQTVDQVLIKQPLNKKLDQFFLEVGDQREFYRTLISVSSSGPLSEVLSSLKRAERRGLPGYTYPNKNPAAKKSKGPRGLHAIFTQQGIQALTPPASASKTGVQNARESFFSSASRKAGHLVKTIIGEIIAAAETEV